MNETEKRKIAYSETLTQFRVHAPLIWTRNNFFLLINSGLFALYLGPVDSGVTSFRFLMPIAGIFLSVIWIRVTYVGRELQRGWRKLVIANEDELFKPLKGPFRQAQEVMLEGESLRASLNNLLIWLSSGFLVVWIILIFLAFVAPAPKSTANVKADINSSQSKAAQ